MWLIAGLARQHHVMQSCSVKLPSTQMRNQFVFLSKIDMVVACGRLPEQEAWKPRLFLDVTMFCLTTSLMRIRQNTADIITKSHESEVTTSGFNYIYRNLICSMSNLICISITLDSYSSHLSHAKAQWDYITSPVRQCLHLWIWQRHHSLHSLDSFFTHFTSLKSSF